MSRQNPAAHLSEQHQAFCRLLRANAGRYAPHDVFRDFCEMSACSLSNTCDPLHREEREAAYLRTVARYTPEEAARMSQMLAVLVEILEAGMTDALGQIFMAMDFGSAWAGQFFTPYEVSRLMAVMTTGDARQDVEQAGFLTLNEPAIGAGAMVIAVADALREQGLNPQQCLHITGVDIDITACHMAYIQLSLLGLPAVIVHGNALTPDKAGSEWLTPFHVMGQWDARLRSRLLAEKLRAFIAAPEQPIPPVTAPAAPSITYDDVARRRDELAGQLALF